MHLIWCSANDLLLIAIILPANAREVNVDGIKIDLQYCTLLNLHFFLLLFGSAPTLVN